ncbi:L-threonine-O-3-phosphate decarboxylase/histidinol-phosphate aminotransferase,TIGR01141 [Lachnospiraceae bacterium XBB1006]|nr:L-threonine-O-3-phosphate decarboxylase/histidinol-phosphate aminotransferase,TIGR01141 [Lachnospiraceae bacterium XBB1006]
MHGGDVYRNNVEYDFSVNINPMGIPESILATIRETLPDLIHYPDCDCYEAKAAIAEYYQVDDNQVLLGNGASELIHAICQAVRPKRALLTAPSFLGYQKALAAVDADVSYFMLLEEDDFAVTSRLLDEIRTTRPDLVFITNPNNPTGVLLSPKFMEQIAVACEKAGAYLVVDECFLELTDQWEDTLIHGMEKFSRLFILRAFTKSFAIPGLRLGYGICKNEEFKNRVAMQLPEWNVSVLAQRVAATAVDESAYLKQSRVLIKQERKQLMAKLTGLGITVYPSEANYILFFEPRGIDWYDKLLQKRILVRDCSDYHGLSKGFYRIAVRTPKENEWLISKMEEIVEDEKRD